MVAKRNLVTAKFFSRLVKRATAHISAKRTRAFFLAFVKQMMYLENSSTIELAPN